MMKNKKIVLIFILIASFIIINLIFNNRVYAVQQTTTTDINSINSNEYPQIKKLLQELKKEHPNWNFKILYTDIEWKEAIANEYVGHGSSPRNLVPANNANYDGEWICSACGGKTYDNGNWHCASESAISYMMDARNSINSTNIFQFMELTYTKCDIQTVKNMVANTFLDSESCINAIISASQKYNVNTYYVIARILQEQGKNGSTLSLGKGYKGQYIGYYNVFNIGASGNGKETIILNGLKTAESERWTSLEASIDGGLKNIAESYIARGQNTLYFQKFDVENSDGKLYWHQYMQNILAAQSEGETLRKTFEEMDAIESDYTFIIPVYKNMPSVAVSRPLTTNSTEIPTNTEIVKVNVTGSLRLRNAPNGDTTVGWVYKNEIVTRLEKATEKINGTYWDYVMKSDGTKGYAARETYDTESTYKLYLVPVETEKPVAPSEIPDIPGESTNIIKTDKIKIDTSSNEVITIPGATVKDLAGLMETELIVKNVSGEVLKSDSKLATGCVINDIYVVSVLGDINGDGEVDTGDTYLLKLVVLGQRTLEGKAFILSSDVNLDGETDTGDTFLLKKQVLSVSNITL